MKKISAILLAVILLRLTTFGQSSKFTTLDRYFAGIPLQSGFEEWFYYVSSHPHLGIDSTTRNENYSSFKSGIASYFPFPDSLKVKLNFQKLIYADSRTGHIVDSVKTVYVQGLFGTGKAARKESMKFFKGLRRELMRYYRYEYRDYYEPASWFYRGKTKAFPYCSLHCGYAENLKSYYVSLVYTDDKSQRIKSYPPPDNTLRH